MPSSFDRPLHGVPTGPVAPGGRSRFRARLPVWSALPFVLLSLTAAIGSAQQSPPDSAPLPAAPAPPPPAPGPVPAPTQTQPSAAARPPGAQLLAFGPYVFAPAQITALQQAGCAFDSTDRAAAIGLAAKGFREVDFVAAYQLFAAGKNYHITIDWAARYAFLRLPVKDVKSADDGQSLTDFYNSTVFGGKGLLIPGAIMTTMGPVVLTLGWLLLNSGNGCASQNPGVVGDIGCILVEAIFGSLLMAAGGAMTVAGLAMGTVGAVKVGRWVHGDLLDNGTADQLMPYRQAVPSVDGASGAQAFNTIEDLPAVRLTVASNMESSFGILHLSF